MTRAPFAAAQSRPLRMLNVVPSALAPVPSKSADRQDMRARRRAHQFAMGRDQAGDGGAMLVWRHRRRQGVVGLRGRANQLGMIGIDAGVDDRHRHVVAFGEGVRLRQMQLGEFVLRSVAFGRCLRLILLQREQVIRLRRGDDPIGFQRTHHRGDRAAIRNPPAEQSRTGQLERLRFDAGEPMPALQRVDLLRTDRVGDFDHYFVGHQPPFVGRRRPARSAPRRALRQAPCALR